MKRTFGFFTSAVIAAIIVFSFTACEVPADPVGQLEVLSGNVLIEYTPPVVIGTVLTANTSELSGGFGAFTFQWQRRTGTVGSWDDISGAINAAYTVTENDEGYFVRVIVNRIDAIGRRESTFVGPVPPAGAPPLEGSVSITYTALLLPGVLLNTNTSGLSGGSGAFTFRWQKRLGLDGNWNNIPGAIYSIYTVTASDENHYIRVVVSRNNAIGQIESDPIGPILPADTPVLGGTVNITYTAPLLLDVQLTADTSQVTGGEGEFIFKWQRREGVSGIWQDITDETNKTYNTKENDDGFYIRVLLYREDAEGERISAPVGPVRAQMPTGNVSQQIAALQNTDPLPVSHTIRTIMLNEQINPQVLDFGGRTIEITIVGMSGDSLSLDRSGAMFTVNSGVTLILEGVTLRGRSPNPVDAVVVVNNGGTLIMEANSRITGNRNTSPVAPLVGPVATTTQGGGVRLATGGTFPLNGGLLDGNHAVWGGGFFSFHGTVNINSGEISRNSAADPVPFVMGVVGQGGGFLDWRGTINMHGGTIRNNTSRIGAGGTLIGTLNLHDGEIYNNTGSYAAGLSMGGVLNIYNGRISNNRAIFHAGMENYGIVNMHGGEISGNVAEGSSGSNGGGVFNTPEGTFNMFGGKISGNDAMDGGGVDNFGTFNMQGGTISGNRAMAGGGVFNDGIFRISNGIIYGNEAEPELRNIALEEIGAAILITGPSTTVRGLFIDGNFGRLGTFTTSSNNTIHVENGQLVTVP